MMVVRWSHLGEENLFNGSVVIHLRMCLLSDVASSDLTRDQTIARPLVLYSQVIIHTDEWIWTLSHPLFVNLYYAQTRNMCNIQLMEATVPLCTSKHAITRFPLYDYYIDGPSGSNAEDVGMWARKHLRRTDRQDTSRWWLSLFT